MKILKSQIIQIIKEELDKIKEELTIDGKKLSPAKEKYIKALAEKEPKLANILRFAGGAKRRKADAAAKGDGEVPSSKIDKAMDKAVENPKALEKLVSNPEAVKAQKVDAQVAQQAAKAFEKARLPPKLTKGQQMIADVEAEIYKLNQQMKSMVAAGKQGTPEHKENISAIIDAVRKIKDIKASIRTAASQNDKMTKWKQEFPELAKKMGMDPSKPGYAEE